MSSNSKQDLNQANRNPKSKNHSRSYSGSTYSSPVGNQSGGYQRTPLSNRYTPLLSEIQGAGAHIPISAKSSPCIEKYVFSAPQDKILSLSMDLGKMI